MKGVISDITEELAASSESTLGKRAYARAIHNISSKLKKPKIDEWIVFFDENLRG